MLNKALIALTLSIGFTAVAQSPRLMLKEYKNQDAIRVALRDPGFLSRPLRDADKASISVVSTGEKFEKKFIVRLTSTFDGVKTCVRDLRVGTVLETLTDRDGLAVIRNQLKVEKIKPEVCGNALATTGI